MRWWAGGIAVAAVAAYGNSFSGPLFFDDTASIVQNESIRHLWPPGPVLSPPAVAGTAGRPLLNLSFALNYAALMDQAFEMGINVFDTANAYGGGRSESMVGAWLGARGAAVRDQVLVCTKVFNKMGSGPNDYGLSRRHIQMQVEGSLKCSARRRLTST